MLSGKIDNIKMSSSVDERNVANAGSNNISTGIERQCIIQIEDKIIVSLENRVSRFCSLNMLDDMEVLCQALQSGQNPCRRISCSLITKPSLFCIVTTLPSPSTGKQ